MLIEGLVDDMLRASFANAVYTKEGVDHVGLFHHFDITDVVRCAALAFPAADGEAHDRGGFGDERIASTDRGPGMDGVAAVKRSQQLAQVHPGLNGRECP